MKKSISQQIGEAGERILEDLLPPTWVVNAQRRDFGKDYVVEIGDHSGELTGTSFFAQLKSTQECRLVNRGTELSFSVKKKHALYYCDQVLDLPVFLFVVDIRAKKGFWLFLQEALAKTNAWRSKRQAGLRIPLSRNVSDSDALSCAVVAARQWMRRRHPTSIQDSIEGHSQRVREIDPRFDVSVSVEAGQIGFNLNPLQPIDVTVVPIDRSVTERMLSVLEAGGSELFTAKDLSIKGSPLFEDAEEFELILKSGVEIEVDAELQARDASGRPLAVLRLSGTLRGGLAEASIELELKRSPFSVCVKGIRHGLDKLESSAFFEAAKWNGQSVGSLAHFAHLYDFVASLSKASSVSFDVARDGNNVFSSEVAPNILQDIPRLKDFLEYIGEIREIARRLDLQIQWSEEFLESESVRQLKEIHSLLTSGSYSRRMPGVVLRTTIRPTGDISTWTKACHPSQLACCGEHRYDGLGRPIVFRALTLTFTDMACEYDEVALENARREGGALVVSFRGSASTVMSAQRDMALAPVVLD